MRISDWSTDVCAFDLGFGVVHRNDETASALQRNADDDEAPLLHGLHRSVTGSRLHGCHRGLLFLIGHSQFIVRAGAHGKSPHADGVPATSSPATGGSGPTAVAGGGVGREKDQGTFPYHLPRGDRSEERRVWK